MQTTIHIAPRQTGKTTHALGLSLIQDNALYVTLNDYLWAHGFSNEAKKIIHENSGPGRSGFKKYITYNQLLTSNILRGRVINNLIFDEYYFLSENMRTKIYRLVKDDAHLSNCNVTIFSTMPFKVNPIALELIRELKRTEADWDLIKDLISSRHTWLIDDFLTDPNTKVIESFIENVDEELRRHMGSEKFELEYLNEWRME